MKQCEFPECDRQHLAKGLCLTHYRQRAAGKELKPIRKYNKVTNGHKQCSKCDVVKPLDEYYLESKGRVQSICKVCQLTEQRTRREAQRGAEQENINAMGVDLAAFIGGVR